MEIITAFEIFCPSVVSNNILVTITLAYSNVFGIFCSTDAEYCPDLCNTPDIKKAQSVFEM